MQLNTLLSTSRSFLEYTAKWAQDLPTADLAEYVHDPARTAVLSVDVTNGFCHEGPLASPRVRSIVQPIVSLFDYAHRLGIRHFVLTQDTHEPDAVEFAQYPAHCVRGTPESETVPELKALPFYAAMSVFPKNSIDSALNTGLDDWLDKHPEVNTFIVVGDCTDLCVYQLAMHIRLRANARQRRDRVIIPADCVDTYDLPMESAQSAGAVPHPGDLMHLIFLYHMNLNGVEIVRTLEAARAAGDERPVSAAARHN